MGLADRFVQAQNIFPACRNRPASSVIVVETEKCRRGPAEVWLWNTC
jgi:hypothetical protein